MNFVAGVLIRAKPKRINKSFRLPQIEERRAYVDGIRVSLKGPNVRDWYLERYRLDGTLTGSVYSLHCGREKERHAKPTRT
jgi:hypothetical protein